MAVRGGKVRCAHGRYADVLDPSGSTLVQLLVEIAIMGIPVSLLLQAVQSARASARLGVGPTQIMACRQRRCVDLYELRPADLMLTTQRDLRDEIAKCAVADRSYRRRVRVSRPPVGTFSHSEGISWTGPVGF